MKIYFLYSIITQLQKLKKWTESHWKYEKCTIFFSQSENEDKNGHFSEDNRLWNSKDVINCKFSTLKLSINPEITNSSS